MTPSVVGVADGVSLRLGKNELLRLLCASYGAKPAQVLFFDDDPLNIVLARAADFPFAVMTPAGFHAAAWAEGVAAFTSGTPTPMPEPPQTSQSVVPPVAAAVAAKKAAPCLSS